MQKTIIITADLGHLKAYAVEHDDDGPGGPRIRLLKTENTDVARHLSALVTDQAGRYRQQPGASFTGQTDRSDGEPHNFGLERRKRALKTLVKDISETVARESPDGWCLAATNEINRALLNALNKTVRARLRENVHANLTGLSKADVLGHFRFYCQGNEQVELNVSRGARPEGEELSSRVRRQNQGNVPRKPGARRTSPLRHALRRQTMGRQVAGEMSRLSDKGDGRRSRAERHVAAAARSRRLRSTP